MAGKWRRGLLALLGGAFAGLVLASPSSATGIENILLGAGNKYYSNLSTTITVGEYINDSNGFAGYCASSIVCSVAIGSISVSAIPGGYTIESVEEIIESGVIISARVIVSGFSASPGGTWLGTVTFNSNTFSGSAASYSYSAGVATWTWSTSTGWAWSDGDEYVGTVGYH